MDHIHLTTVPFGLGTVGLDCRSGKCLVIKGFTELDNVPVDVISLITKKIDQARLAGDVIMFVSTRHSVLTSGDLPSEFKVHEQKEIVCGMDDIADLNNLFTNIENSGAKIEQLVILSYSKGEIQVKKINPSGLYELVQGFANE